MRVAVLFTGHCREFRSTFETFKTHIFDRYETDVYICSWNVIEHRPVHNHRFINQPLRSFDSKEVVALYNTAANVVASSFMDWDTFQKARFPPLSLDVATVRVEHTGFWIERLRDQWWVVKKGWKLIQNPDQYDLILRSRFDLMLESIPMQPTDKFVVPLSDLGLVYCDYIAYGTPATMQGYCHLFDHIESLYHKSKVDVSYAEGMLKYYIEKVLKMRTQSPPTFRYHIRRSFLTYQDIPSESDTTPLGVNALPQDGITPHVDGRSEP